jgi:translation initiation factor 2 subunit 2
MELGIYDINFLLDRAYGSFTLDKGNIRLVEPIFEKKDRKSYVHNFQEICKGLNRTPEQIKLFFEKELNMGTSIKENGSLKIDGMPQTQTVINKIIKTYINNYIRCQSCKSCKTKVEKVDRIIYLVCDVCKSSKATEKN